MKTVCSCQHMVMLWYYFNQRVGSIQNVWNGINIFTPSLIIAIFKRYA